MFRISLACLFFLIVPACGRDAGSRPGYVLSEERFIDLLVDMTLAESATAINIVNVPGNRIDSVYAFDPLEEHKVSRAVYDSTLRYYAGRPEEYKAVYSEVLTRLSALESARQGVKADSVAR